MKVCRVLSWLIVSGACVWGASDAAEVTAIEALQVRHSIPVVAYSLWRNGSVVELHVLGARSDTPMRWGSITKNVTALTLLKMQDAGILDVNQKVIELTKGADWTNTWQPTHPITVLQLLELTAGFTDLSRLEFNYAKPISLPGALALNPRHRQTRWPPGLQHSYSNLTPGLSQLVIERVSGLSYAEAVAKYVFEPLNMRGSDFAPRSDLPGGFKADGSTPIPFWHMTFPAYGALNAPLADMQHLLDALMQGKHLSTTAMRHLMHPSTSLAARSGFDFEYAAGLYPRVRQQHVWHTHGGDADGYRSRMAFMRDHKRGYIAAINTDNPQAMRDLEALLEVALTQDLARRDPPPPYKGPEHSLDEWQGQYYPSSTRFALSRWRNGKLDVARVRASSTTLTTLQFERGARVRNLIAVSKNLFRREQDPVATVAFVRDANGHRFIQGELGNYVRINSPEGCPDFMQDICRILSK